MVSPPGCVSLSLIPIHLVSYVSFLQKATDLHLFFLFSEFDKVLLQLSQRCGESIKHADVLFLFPAVVFIWRVVKLKLVLLVLIKPSLFSMNIWVLRSKNNPRLLAFTPAAMSAGPLKIESTAEGFKLYCSLKYYINQLKTSWFFK